MKTIITKEERLQIHGILVLGQIAAKQMKQCDEALNILLEAKDDFETGLLNEEYFEDNLRVDYQLKRMGITVKK